LTQEKLSNTSLPVNFSAPSHH